MRCFLCVTCSLSDLPSCQGVMLDALREERRLLPVVSLRHRPTASAEDVQRNSLFRQEVEHLGRGRGLDRVCELACVCVDLRDLQLPNHVNLCTTCWREYVGVRDKSQIISPADVFDVVFDGQTSADDLDVDRHTTAVRRGGYAGGAVCWRARLV